MTTVEPEWDEQERAEMLGLAVYRDTRCPSCGQDIRDCTSSKTEGKYVVPPPTRCHATTALLVAQKPYADAPQSGALLWRTERR